MAPPEPSREILEEDPPNLEAPPEALVGEITPTDLCYVRTHFGVPELDEADYRLRVEGAVEEPAEIGLEELRGFPRRSVTMTLECAGNGRRVMSPRPSGTPWGYGGVSVVRYTGTPLVGLLERTGLEDGVEEICFEGADEGRVETGETVSFARSLPLDVARRPDVLLAWRMNGEPLPPVHGSPLRLVVPGWYAMSSVKWLRRIEALREPFRGWFQANDYVYEGEEGTPDGTPVRRIRVRSLIARPRDGAVLGGERIELIGVAWSGAGAVERVEVSADAGESWSRASLEPAEDRWAPVRWRHVWAPPGPGEYTLLTRATDAEGNTQPLESRWNRRGYGNNPAQRLRVTVA